MRFYGDDAEVMNLPRMQKVEDLHVQAVWVERAILDEYRRLWGDYTILEQKYNELLNAGGEPTLP